MSGFTDPLVVRADLIQGKALEFGTLLTPGVTATTLIVSGSSTLQDASAATLSVAGATSAGSLAAGALVVSGAAQLQGGVTVSGTAALGALTAASAAISSTLSTGSLSVGGAATAGALSAGIVAASTSLSAPTAAISALTGVNTINGSLYPPAVGSLPTDPVFNTVMTAAGTTVGGTLSVAGTATLAALIASTVAASTSLSAPTAAIGALTGVNTINGSLYPPGVGSLPTDPTFNSVTTTAAAAIGTTLSVGGTATLAAVNATNVGVSGTLGVTGVSTLAAVNATNVSASGTLGVTGVSTLAAVNATNVSASGTLGVTGASTLAAMSATSVTAPTAAIVALTGVMTINGGSYPPIGPTPSDPTFTTVTTTAGIAVGGAATLSGGVTVPTGTSVQLQGSTGLNVGAGGITAASTITASAGNVVAAAGNVVAQGSVTATTGNVVATAGDVVAAAGNVVATTGNVIATAGSVLASAGNIMAATGNVVATAGDVVATAGRVRAANLGPYGFSSAGAQPPGAAFPTFVCAAGRTMYLIDDTSVAGSSNNNGAGPPRIDLVDTTAAPSIDRFEVVNASSYNFYVPGGGSGVETVPTIMRLHTFSPVYSPCNVLLPMGATATFYRDTTSMRWICKTAGAAVLHAGFHGLAVLPSSPFFNGNINLTDETVRIDTTSVGTVVEWTFRWTIPGAPAAPAGFYNVVVPAPWISGVRAFASGPRPTWLRMPTTSDQFPAALCQNVGTTAYVGAKVQFVDPTYVYITHTRQGGQAGAVASGDVFSVALRFVADAAYPATL